MLVAVSVTVVPINHGWTILDIEEIVSTQVVVSAAVIVVVAAAAVITVIVVVAVEVVTKQ